MQEYCCKPCKKGTPFRDVPQFIPQLLPANPGKSKKSVHFCDFFLLGFHAGMGIKLECQDYLRMPQNLRERADVHMEWAYNCSVSELLACPRISESVLRSIRGANLQPSRPAVGCIRHSEPSEGHPSASPATSFLMGHPVCVAYLLTMRHRSHTDQHRVKSTLIPRFSASASSPGTPSAAAHIPSSAKGS